jgi:hypothetical protein
LNWIETRLGAKLFHFFSALLCYCLSFGLFALRYSVPAMIRVAARRNVQPVICVVLLAIMLYATGLFPSATLFRLRYALSFRNTDRTDHMRSLSGGSLGLTSELHIGGHGTLEKLLLAKAFSQSMRPTDITPFYYRASELPSKGDVTITTIVTPNRLQRLANLVEHYQGPVSAAIHIPTTNATRCAELLATLHAIYTSSRTLRRHLDVHLVLDAFDRQFNTWRNIARLFARSDYVMMLDVDFWLCTDFRSALRKRASKGVMAKLGGGKAALVVPAFEFLKQEEGRNASAFPRDKEVCLWCEIGGAERVPTIVGVAIPC